jgi:peptidyl-tRNA hydrolase, PTH1 family
MKIIVGLGNPGNKYEHTRHNAGFMAVDFYLKNREAISCASKFRGYVCEMHFAVAERRGNLETRKDAEKIPKKTFEKVFFVKPQTYMNKSGEAVKEIVDFYKLNVATDLLIIHDEIDLKFGFYKLAFDSRPAGHNGVKNIVEELGTQEFHRVRIGVESRLSRHESPTDQFVLQEFTPDELQIMETNVLPKVADEIETFILS